MPSPTTAATVLPRALLRTFASLSTPRRPAISIPTLSCRTTAASAPAILPRIARATTTARSFSASAAVRDPPREFESDNNAPAPPAADKASTATAYLGTQKRLPEFSLRDKVVLVSGGARGLGLTQAEALLEAGATGESSLYVLCAFRGRFQWEGDHSPTIPSNQGSSSLEILRDLDC